MSPVFRNEPPKKSIRNTKGGKQIFLLFFFYNYNGDLFLGSWQYCFYAINRFHYSNCSFGPESYQGQLPGTILEMDANNGRTTYIAIEVSTKTDVTKIKEPTKEKKLTAAEFAKEREKLFSEMQQNGGGNMRVIRN